MLRGQGDSGPNHEPTSCGAGLTDIFDPVRKEDHKCIIKKCRVIMNERCIAYCIASAFSGVAVSCSSVVGRFTYVSM